MTANCVGCGYEPTDDETAVALSVLQCGLCPACQPDECPDCGGSDVGYSVVDRRWRCDNGCGPFRHDEVTAE